MMSRLPPAQTDLQIRLMKLLPADGTPVTVRSLAAATQASQYQVTNAFFDAYLGFQVDYDIRSDAYSARRGSQRAAA